MYIAILGRQPGLSMAELERCYGSASTRWFSEYSALVDASSLSVETLGGTIKAGRVVMELHTDNWRKITQQIVHQYSSTWQQHEGKLTLGISAYEHTATAREVQKIGILLKSQLKKSGGSLRLVPNQEAALNTATSHHNKLGLSPSKVELLIVRGKSGHTIVAESVGTQNITALARRDQGRPKRDAFVGMLPPKLALIMINLAAPLPSSQISEKSARRSLPAGPANESTPTSRKSEISLEVGAAPLVATRLSTPPSKPLATSFSGTSAAPMEPGGGSRGIGREAVPGKDGSGEGEKAPLRLLDAFCGTGVVLQEAALLGYNVYGTDLSEKMIRYSRDNLNWLEESHRIKVGWYLHEGDAMTTTWQQPIDLVVSETYLGQPFSAPPSPAKLEEVRGNVNRITTSFLKNIHSQLAPGTPLCLAIPAWRDNTGRFTHLPLTRSLTELGFTPVTFMNIEPSDLLYYREDQVVARQLLVLTRT